MLKYTNNVWAEFKFYMLFTYPVTIHSLCRSPNRVRMMKYGRLRWACHVARMEEGRSALKILTGKLTGWRPLERPMLRWKDNNRMYL